MYLCFHDSLCPLNEGFFHSTITRQTGEKHYATSFTFKDLEIPTSLLVVSRYTIFTPQRNWLEQIINAAKKTSKTDSHSIEFYISLLFHYLTYNPMQNNYVEIYKTEHEQIFNYSNSKENYCSISNLPFKDLLMKITPNNIFKLLSPLLLERMIVLLQDTDNDLAIMLACLLSLMTPLYFYLKI